MLRNLTGLLALEETQAAILLELAQKLEAGQAIALTPETLAALETVTASITNLPETYPLPELQLGTLATQATLAQVLTRLGDIFNAVDGLEVTAGNIEFNASNLNLQTDEVEALLRQVRDRLNFPLPDLQIAELRSVTVTNPTANPEVGIAKENTLEALRALLASKDFATQTTLEALRVLLASKDFATQATLDQIRQIQIGRLPTYKEHFDAGRVRAAMGMQTIGTTGGTSYFVIVNPAGSGVNIRLHDVTMSGSPHPLVAGICRDATPTNVSATTGTSPLNRAVAAPSPKGLFYIGLAANFANVGLAYSNYNIAVNSVVRETVNLPLIVPGQTAGVFFNMPVSTSSGDTRANIVYIEEPI